MLDLGSVQLSETNRSYLKMDGWKMNFLLGPSVYFQGRTISLGEGDIFKRNKVFKEKLCHHLYWWTVKLQTK